MQCNDSAQFFSHVLIQFLFKIASYVFILKSNLWKGSSAKKMKYCWQLTITSATEVTNFDLIHFACVNSKCCFNFCGAQVPEGSLTLGKTSSTKSSVFFNIAQTALDPPSLILNIYVANFSKGLLKECINACRDKCIKIVSKSLGKCVQ